MKNKTVTFYLIPFIFFLVILFISNSALAGKTLYLGLFPRFNSDQTRIMFSPLANYLQDQLQQPVKLLTSKDFESFNVLLKSGKLDIVHFNQYHYLQAHKRDGYEVILRNEEFARSTISSAIVVRKDSNIKSISQLKGKKIMFGGGTSAMMSSIVPHKLLQQAGLNSEDYQVLYARNPPNAIIAAFSGDADAAGIGTVVLELDMVKNYIDIQQLSILAQSKKLAHLPWAVKKNMDSTLKKRIQTILANLSKSAAGKDILHGANLTNLIPSSDSDYEAHRVIIFDVLGENY